MNQAAPSDGSLDAVRRRNLAAVLTIAHRCREVSRAAITTETGFSRSGVGNLIADLEACELVQQSIPRSGGSATVGRPSPIVSPTQRYLSVAINPDVDGLRIALVSLAGEVVRDLFCPSTQIMSPREAAQLTAEAIGQLQPSVPESTLVGICAAIPGRVSKDGSTVLFAPHIRWNQVNFAELLSAATGLPARVAFDARLGLNAETLWGSAQRSRDVVYFYGGPGGIGAAAMVDGHLLGGSFGGAARLGHIKVTEVGPTCVCGTVGCLTTVVSHHHLGAALGLERATLTQLRQAISQKHSAATTSFLDRQLEHLGTALRMAFFAFDPEQIMLGGFFQLLLDHGGEALRASLPSTSPGALHKPPLLITPELGEHQLLIGAGTAAFAPMLEDPVGFVRSLA